jgi:hypothetical protein
MKFSMTITRNSFSMTTRKMWPINTSDCLIKVTTWAEFWSENYLVHDYFNHSMESQINRHLWCLYLSLCLYFPILQSNLPMWSPLLSNHLLDVLVIFIFIFQVLDPPPQNQGTSVLYYAWIQIVGLSLILPVYVFLCAKFMSFQILKWKLLSTWLF